MQRTLVFLKPDAVQRGLIGPIITRIERRGLKLAGLKLMRVSEVLARRHYTEHEGKPFYEGLVQFVTSSPVIAMLWEGKDAVQIARDTIGATDPAKAAPGTIRADFGVDLGRNLVHGSRLGAVGGQGGGVVFLSERDCGVQPRQRALDY